MKKKQLYVNPLMKSFVVELEMGIVTESVLVKGHNGLRPDVEQLEEDESTNPFEIQL